MGLYIAPVCSLNITVNRMSAGTSLHLDPRERRLLSIIASLATTGGQLSLESLDDLERVIGKIKGSSAPTEDADVQMEAPITQLSEVADARN